MRKLFHFLLLGCGLAFLAGCSRQFDAMSSIRSKWQSLRNLWGEDTEGMLASEGFYGPMDDEFIPLEENDLQMQFVDEVVPQPREIPGDPNSNVPSLNQFKKAFADLAYVFQNVYFNTDDHVLRRVEYIQMVDRIASCLKKHPNIYVAVGGHCDERASEEYNLALGTRRANYVRRLLVERGIHPERIHSVSYGKEQPIDLGHNAASWARNRRVEFRIHEK